MSINYRKVDPMAVSSDVMKQRAIELEQRAYAMETEVDCLVRLCEEDPTNGILIDQLSDARTLVEKLRRAATRGAGAAPLSSSDVQNARSTFLDQWLKSLEETHAQRVAFLNEANRQLGLKGSDALTGDEIADADQAIAQLTKEIEQLESRHVFCNERIDNLEVDDSETDIHDHNHTHIDAEA